MGVHSCTCDDLAFQNSVEDGLGHVSGEVSEGGRDTLRTAVRLRSLNGASKRFGTRACPSPPPMCALLGRLYRDTSHFAQARCGPERAVSTVR